MILYSLFFINFGRLRFLIKLWTCELEKNMKLTENQNKSKTASFTTDLSHAKYTIALYNV